LRPKLLVRRHVDTEHDPNPIGRYARTIDRAKLPIRIRVIRFPSPADPEEGRELPRRGDHISIRALLSAPPSGCSTGAT